MKKISFILAALIALAAICLYTFIPGKITISRSIKIEANDNALYRKLENGMTWKEWWPGTNVDAKTFSLDGIEFKPGAAKIVSVPLSVDGGEFVSTAELTLIPLRKDSTTIQIETSIAVSNNPFKRVKTYFESKKLDHGFSEILAAIDTVYSKISNLYDYDIKKELVVDSILVFTSEETKGYPPIGKIYELIDELKGYIRKNAALETGFPMQNIYTADSVNYLVKVAIPVNKRLPDSGKIRYKWMLGGGNILITEVRGGPNEVNKAYKQILNYISDYDRIAPAISFESLVTDRRKEPDSSKWITRIYYPVM